MKTVWFGTQGQTGRTRGREEMKPGDGQDTHLGSKINGSREKEKTHCPLSWGNRKAKWQHAKWAKKHNAFSGLLATKIHFGESQKTTKCTFQLYANLSNPLFASILRGKKSKSFSSHFALKPVRLLPFHNLFYLHRLKNCVYRIIFCLQFAFFTYTHTCKFTAYR